MKRTLLLLAMLIAFKFSNAQWLNQSGTGNYYLTSGFVGIGVNNPSGKLTIEGYNSSFVGTELGVARSNSAAGVGQSPAIQFTDRSTGYSSIIQSFNGQLQFFNNNGSSWYESMRILGNGKIGIGTDTPLSTFQVDDGCTKANIGDASGETLGWGTSYLGFNAGRSGSNWTIHSDGFNNGGGAIYSSIFGDIYFSSIPSIGGPSDRTLTDADIASRIAFRISNGAAYAKKMYVTVSSGVWPDYVFKPNYQLKSLSEVKSYIDQNHHLPDVPAAAKVERDGQDLGEMNKLLLKKVEELTLYLIQKDNEIKAQKVRLDKLETRMNAAASKK